MLKCPDRGRRDERLRKTYGGNTFPLKGDAMFKKSISSVLIASVALAVILAVSAIVAYVSNSTNGLALDLNKQAMSR